MNIIEIGKKVVLYGNDYASLEYEDLKKLVLAHRFIYYVLMEPVISDAEYDILEGLMRSKDRNSRLFNLIGSSNKEDYPDEIQMLGIQIHSYKKYTEKFIK